MATIKGKSKKEKRCEHIYESIQLILLIAMFVLVFVDWKIGACVFLRWSGMIPSMKTAVPRGLLMSMKTVIRKKGCAQSSDCAADCGRCVKHIELGAKAAEFDGFILGAPVHYASASGGVSFMDRAFYSAFDKDVFVVPIPQPLPPRKGRFKAEGWRVEEREGEAESEGRGESSIFPFLFLLVIFGKMWYTVLVYK